MIKRERKRDEVAAAAGCPRDDDVMINDEAGGHEGKWTKRI